MASVSWDGSPLGMISRSPVLHCICLALAFCATVHAGTYNEINVDRAYAILGADPNAFLLDVRAQYEYEGGHIPGAYLIPHSEISQRKGELPADLSVTMIVYCLAGYRSATASGVLSDLGYSNVSNVLGGFSEWKAKGYPFVVGAGRGTFPVCDALTPVSGAVLAIGLALARGMAPRAGGQSAAGLGPRRSV